MSLTLMNWFHMCFLLPSPNLAVFPAGSWNISDPDLFPLKCPTCEKGQLWKNTLTCSSWTDKNKKIKKKSLFKTEHYIEEFKYV